MLRLGARRWISSSATTTRLVQPAANASSSSTAPIASTPATTITTTFTSSSADSLDTATSDAVQSSTASPNIIDNSATQAESFSQFTHLLTSSDFQSSLMTMMPWWGLAIGSVGFCAPFLQETLLFKPRQKYLENRQKLFENSEMMIQRTRLNLGKITPKAGAEMAEIEKKVKSMQIPTLPLVGYLVNQFWLPILGTKLVQKVFSSDVVAGQVPNGWDICQMDPTYLIALPVVYLNTLIFREFRVMRRHLPEQVYSLTQFMAVTSSIYCILSPSSIAATLFLSSYAAGLWSVTKICDSPRAMKRLGWKAELKRLPYVQNGLYRPPGRLESFREIWRAI